jgi:hypothetical protein
LFDAQRRRCCCRKRQFAGEHFVSYRTNAVDVCRRAGFALLGDFGRCVWGTRVRCSLRRWRLVRFDLDVRRFIACRFCDGNRLRMQDIAYAVSAALSGDCIADSQGNTRGARHRHRRFAVEQLGKPSRHRSQRRRAARIAGRFEPLTIIEAIEDMIGKFALTLRAAVHGDFLRTQNSTRKERGEILSQPLKKMMNDE